MLYLSSGQPIFLIDFHGVSQHFIFHNKPAMLGNLIAEHGKHGIFSIKQYVPAKGMFKKLSKKEVSNWFDWDTHTMEQLKKTNFIK
jgi:hypothetical protein